MKWAYLPTLFFLAFVYTKLSFNDFMAVYSSHKIGRSPAMAQEKISLVENSSFDKDFYLFFRESSLYFYKQVQNYPMGSAVKSLERFQGIIVGDLHVENFGFILDDKTKPSFTINDFDETTKGAVFHDVIRHFIAGKIISKELEWSKYLEVYQKGLMAHEYTNSFLIRKETEEASGKINEILKENINFSGPFKFKKHKSGRPTSQIELKFLTEALEKKYPKIKIYDHYVRIKKIGGSAGLRRFQVIARLEPHDRIRWLDIKEASLSNYEKVFKEKITTFKERLADFKEFVYEGKFDQTVNLLEIEGVEYGLRFVDQFAYSFKVEDCQSDDLLDVIYDQAYLAGKIHRNSLKNDTSLYSDEVKKIKSAEIEEIMNSLLIQMRKKYQGQ